MTSATRKPSAAPRAVSGLTKQVMTRVFEYAGVSLPDPDPTMQPQQVRDFLAATGRPELTNAEVQGPVVRGTQLVYTIHRTTGTKGARRAAGTRRRRPRAALEAQLARLEREATATRSDPVLSPVLSALGSNIGPTVITLPSPSVPWVG